MNHALLFGATVFAALGLCLHGALAPVVFAALPPSAYEQLRKDAPEVLLLEVTHVRHTVREGEGRDVIEIAAIATVRGVTRSAGRTKKGAVILVHYESFVITTPGWAGPSPVPQVEAGRYYKAWLQKTRTAEDGERYVPAAQAWSFVRVDGSPNGPLKQPWLRWLWPKR